MALRFRTTVVAFAAVLVLALGAPGASASNWAGNTGRTGCAALNMTDNRTHTFHKVNISHFNRAISRTAAYLRGLEQTNRMYQVSKVTKHTDIVFRDGNYSSYCGYAWYGRGGSVIGHTKCHRTHASGRCDKHQIRFSAIWAKGATQDQRFVVALHEVGHALGLRHRDGDAMQSPLSDHQFLSRHSINHLNNL